MIDRVTIRRFKRFEEEVFDLKPFNLLIGPNNHGKTTLLQALSAWQLAYSTWRAARKVEPGKISKNLRGVPIVLPNFHSVPLTDFKHLWTGKRTQWHDREKYEQFKEKREDNGTKQKYQGKYSVEIIVEWTSMEGNGDFFKHHFGMAFLYDNEQAILVKPTPDTEELPHDTDSIVITHIPPFSGLSAQEPFIADGRIRSLIGLSQTGSVVRNLLWRVFEEDKQKWEELKKNVERFLCVRLLDPKFVMDIDTDITCEYVDSLSKSKEPFDLVNGGSGFHQLVTIFAILYWNKGTHLLLDEPDAHLHAWAQSGLLEFLKEMTRRGHAQIVIATHSLAMLDRCKPEEIYSLMKASPHWLIEDKEKFSVRSGLDTVETSVLASLQEIPFILYVEGTSDIEMLRLFARALGKDETLFDEAAIHVLCGRNPKEVREHFMGVKTFRADSQALCVLDPDLDRESLIDSIEHNREEQLDFHVWSRRHLESYLLVPEAIERAVYPDMPLFENTIANRFRTFLAQPPRAYVFPDNVTDYRDFHLDWMITFDAKRQIFSPSEKDGSFLLSEGHSEITPQHVAQVMHEDEVHNDVKNLIDLVYEKSKRVRARGGR